MQTFARIIALLPLVISLIALTVSFKRLKKNEERAPFLGTKKPSFGFPSFYQ